MTAPYRVLGIDASLRSTGLAVVEAAGSRLSAVAIETIKVPVTAPRSECLCRISQAVRALIDRTLPAAAAMESGFFHRNPKTADLLGQVRGAAVAACACAGIPVYEYAPRRAKQAVVGFGAAEKEQVRAMVVRMLGLTELPQLDASDALALAICHLNSRSAHEALAPKPI